MPSSNLKQMYLDDKKIFDDAGVDICWICRGAVCLSCRVSCSDRSVWSVCVSILYSSPGSADRTGAFVLGAWSSSVHLHGRRVVRRVRVLGARCGVPCLRPSPARAR